MRILWKALAWIIVVTAVAVVIFVSVTATVSWISQSRLRRQVAAIRAAGDPVSFADLAGRSVPPDQDAGVFLRRAEKGLAAIMEELGEVCASESYQQGRPTESELKAIQSALEAHADVIALLDQAAACPDYDPQAEYSTDERALVDANRDRMRSIRVAIRVLQARVLLLLSQGKRDEAIETCIAIFRLARLYEREPFVTGYLVAIACREVAIESTNRVLRSGPLAPDARKALDAQLARHEGVEGYEWALKTERVAGLETFRATPNKGGWLANARRSQEQSICLDLLEEQIGLASSTYDEIADAYYVHVRDLRASGPLAKLLPPVQAMRDAMDRTRAEIRSLRVLNALQRAAEQGGPDEPDLADLGLPRDAILDPFTGGRLRVKKLPEGWIIYSVGRDGQDDGGKTPTFDDYGVAPLPPSPQVTETQKPDY